MPRRRRPHAAPALDRHVRVRQGRAPCVPPDPSAPPTLGALRALIRARIAELEPLAEELERLRHVLTVLDELPED